MAGLSYHGRNSGKSQKDKPGVHRPVLEKRQNGAQGEREKPHIGCDRLSGFEEQALLAAVYTPLVPLLNFFMSAQKLKSKTRSGSKKIKAYDEPRSPLQRLIECAELPQKRKDSLVAHGALYNPAELQQNVNKAILRQRQRLAQANRVPTQERTWLWQHFLNEAATPFDNILK
jgi:hypothetical protein